MNTVLKTGFFAHEGDAGILEAVLHEIERGEGDVIAVCEDDEDFEGWAGCEDVMDDVEVTESGVAPESEGEVGQCAEVSETGPGCPDGGFCCDFEVGDASEGGVEEVGLGD